MAQHGARTGHTRTQQGACGKGCDERPVQSVEGACKALALAAIASKK